MKSLFRIENVPSDTQMQTILDPLETDLLRPMFHDIFCQLQRGKALEPTFFTKTVICCRSIARDTTRRNPNSKLIVAGDGLVSKADAE